MWAVHKHLGDPLCLASGPLKRYAWEWWHSSEPSSFARPRHSDALTPGQLSRVFHSAVATLQTTQRKP
eukprot:4361690-Pyramimonas_sp.AAC.1